ncbi:unnamed protein product [marine sediment metagenome]|uniref:SprT-like domain-containing protein n=1 Tax=marine sediment metagenome TaxID=412755 RepID=X1BR20_9ZZZZ
MITISQVKNIGREITGLKITTNRFENTAFFFDNRKAHYININRKQLQNIYTLYSWSYLRYGIDNRGIYLQALLHEIAHYKQYKKCGGYHWEEEYNNNPNYYEKVANRYSTRYYKLIRDSITKG